MEGPALKAFSVTDVGKHREINEDYVYTSEQPVGGLPNLFIVADGMGGHNAGDYASSHAVMKFTEEVANSRSEIAIEDILVDAVSQANTYIYQSSLKDASLSGMGTTLVAASYEGNCLKVVNVGDSRLYIINQEITQVTKDHSLVEEIVSLGGMDKESARNHPDKNIITRAIGVKPVVKADLFTVRMQKGDKFLLCSDGLTNMVRDEEIHQIIRESESIETAAKKLIETANEHGGRDNIAVVLVEPFGGCE